MNTKDKQILVIEDNKYSMNRVQNILKHIPDIIIIKADNSGDAYKYALEYTIDLFIIDIILETTTKADISGIKFAETIRGIERYEFTPMIFTTSMQDSQLYAYSMLHCYKYFEKPYDEKELLQAVTQVLRFHQSRKEQKENYCYKEDGILYVIKAKEIVYIDNQLTKLLIRCDNGEIVQTPYRSGKNILLELNSNRFYKCNKNIIINLDYVNHVDLGHRIVTMKESYGSFTIGRRFLKGLVEELSND